MSFTSFHRFSTLHMASHFQTKSIKLLRVNFPPLEKPTKRWNTDVLRRDFHTRPSKRLFSIVEKGASTTPPTHPGSRVQAIEEGDMQNLITHHYEESHMPLIFSNRVYGPPYTDTKKLEKLPEEVFDFHYHPEGFGDRFAISMVEFFKIFNKFFFRDKYTHHAVVLETVAAVPGMVAGMFRHFRSLRRMERDFGWIGKLLEEAENERMHLLTWMQVIRPTLLERWVVLAAQMFYTPFYAFLYIFTPKIAHRFVGYLEETACHEYTHFLKAIDSGRIPNVPAPDIAKRYWNLAPDATLRDVVLVIRADEAMHRDVNHNFSKKMKEGLH